MIFIISNERDIATDLFVMSLKKRGVGFVRLNTDVLLTGTNFLIGLDQHPRVKLVQYGQELNLSEVGSVWYRRPVLPKMRIKSSQEKAFTEREILAVLDSMWGLLADKFWVSPPYAIRDASRKLIQLSVAKELGFNIPETIVTNSFEEVKRFFTDYHGLMIYKPITVGRLSPNTSTTQLMVYSKKIGVTDLPKMRLVANCPGMFQKYINKKYELRVTVVGDKVFPTKINSQRYSEKRVDWRKGKYIKEMFTKCEIPRDIERKTVNFMNRFGLQFGAFDLIVDENNNITFLECNPNGEWGWIEDCTKMPITDALIDLLVKRS